MLLPYLLAFCRLSTGILFAYSFLMKVRDGEQFARTIANFRLLPRQLSQPAAILLLIGELAIVLLVVAGGQWLPPGFGLAALLLLVFTTALAWTLAKRIDKPCNCFGAISKKNVTIYDLWRNAGFFLCAAGGWVISHFGNFRPLTWAEWSVTVMPALVLVMLMTHLNEIMALFQPVREN